MSDNQGALAPALNPLRFIPGCNTPEGVRAEHIRINSGRNIRWLEEEPLKDKPLYVVAGGPSLKHRWAELLDKHGTQLHDIDILALNNAYGFLLEKGIVPNYFMLMDARPENAQFVQDYSVGTMHYLAAQCHPDVFDALLNGKKTLWFSHEDAAKQVPGKKLMLAAPVGTVGMKALSLGFALGYREFRLYGYDSSYADTHHAYPQELNDNSTTIEVFIERGGKKYITTPAFANQAAEFVPFARDLMSFGCQIELHCSGLLPDIVAASNARGEIPLVEREREKYQEIWSRENYAGFAPGEHFVDLVIEVFGIQPGDELIDYGCGSGKAATMFERRDIKTTGIDFAMNCVQPGANFSTFLVACLWDLPDVQSDWAYCTDVMEHIPSEKVNDVLRGIADRTRKGAFFNIATRDDVMGGMIGKRLHMTVITAQAWLDLLSQYWTVEMIEGDGQAKFFCKSKG